MPGYTHLQRAIPVTLGHHLLAWVEMLERDRDALPRSPAAQAAPSPLGAGALAGSTLPLPPPPDPMRNSIDAVADRDFALDYLYACAVLFAHLSRIGEELVLWTTTEFGFARLPEDAATGSSMMPQKLNADVAELARGKAGTAIGRLTGLLATVKGLPLAYNRDLQEDKPPVFAARARRRGRARRARPCSSRGLDVRPRAAGGRLRRPAAARDRRGRGARPRGRAVPRRARAGRRAGARRHVRAARRRRAAARRRRGCGRGGEGALVVKSPLPVSLAGRDLLRITDLVPAEVEAILDLADELKVDRTPRLPGKTLGLIFGQPSTRTRISFGGRDRPARRRLRHAHAGRDAALARRVAQRHGARALALPRRARDPRALARRARGSGPRRPTIPVINALTVGRAPVPGARRRAHDPRAARRASTASGSRWVGDGTNVLVSLAAAREADRHGGRRRLPGGLRPAGGHAADARPRPARGRARAPTCSSPTSGSRSARRSEREQRLRDLEPYRLDEALVALAVAGGDRAPLPAGAPRRGDHAGRALRRALGRLGRGREPPARAEGAARAAARLIRTRWAPTCSSS